MNSLQVFFVVVLSSVYTNLWWILLKLKPGAIKFISVAGLVLAGVICFIFICSGIGKIESVHNTE